MTTIKVLEGLNPVLNNKPIELVKLLTEHFNLANPHNKSVEGFVNCTLISVNYDNKGTDLILCKGKYDTEILYLGHWNGGFVEGQEPQQPEVKIESELTISSALQLMAEGKALPDGWVLQNGLGHEIKSVSKTCSFPYSVTSDVNGDNYTVTSDGRYGVTRSLDGFDLTLNKPNKD